MSMVHKAFSLEIRRVSGLRNNLLRDVLIRDVSPQVKAQVK